ncbi:MAG: coiled-coil domain-containing protein [Bacteroidota bacterium]
MEKKNNSVTYLTISIIVLGIAFIVVGYLWYNQKQESDKVILQLEEYSTFIEEQKDSLELELKEIIVQYDSLMTENDTMNLKLTEQQEKIERLLRIRLSDAEKIRKYEKELGTIRKVLRSYIVQIDSLNTKNQILMAENKELRNRSTEVENVNRQLSEEKEELLAITDEAKTLLASEITTIGLNKRSREKDKFNKVEKLRTDFLIRKNKVAEPGSRIIYLRLIRPDGVVLGSTQAGVIEVNEEQIPFSASREIIYENNDVPVSIYWDNNGDLVAGTYQAELYESGKLIGETEFSLQ